MPVDRAVGAARNWRVLADLFERVDAIARRYAAQAGRGLTTEIRFVKTGTSE